MRLWIRKLEKLILNKWFLPLVYAWFARNDVEKALVLFADSRQQGIPIHMKAMYQEMKEQGYHVENWCVDFGTLSLAGKVKYLYRFMKRFAVSETVILCDYFMPVASCSKRKETRVIQLWHACGMLKKFGYDAADDLGHSSESNYNKNIDLWTVSSQKCVPVF